MLSHVFVGVSDFDRAFAFYETVLGVIGAGLRFVDRTRPWAGWQSSPGPRPLFLIGRPFDGHGPLPGNGQMVAFSAGERGQVERAHAVALTLGGRCEGPPGVRPQYHGAYYGAYFRDPDGNKLCVVCHVPP